MARAFRMITRNLIVVLSASLAARDVGTSGVEIIGSTGMHHESVYRILKQCERSGMMTSQWVNGDGAGRARHRVYRFTDADGAARAQRLVDDYASHIDNMA